MENIPKIANFMNNKFVTLDPDLNIYDAIKILLKKKITGTAVVDKKNCLVGILSEKDCLNVLVQGLYDRTPGKTVSQYMVKKIITISPEADILYAADLFLTNSFRQLLVVDKERKLLGLITRSDLLRAMQYKNTKKYNHISGLFSIKQHSNITI